MEPLTTAAAARELQVTENYIRQLCQAGRLGRKFGPVWLITREEIETFKANRRPPGRPPKEESQENTEPPLP